MQRTVGFSVSSHSRSRAARSPVADPTCWTAPGLIPRGSTPEIWKRAKANRAPANTVAVIELRSYEGGTQGWRFQIFDPLRDINVDLEIPDTCAAVVEKP